MLGLIGVTGILAIGGLIASLVITAVSVAVNVGISVKQSQEAEQQHQEALRAQKDAQDKQKARLEAQKKANFRHLERSQLANMMAMGSAILVEKFRTKRTKQEIVKTQSKMSSNKSKAISKYSYGSPVASAEKSAQLQNQTQN